MATLNPRINITIPNEIAGILYETAKKNKKSVSKIALELLEWAIEEREDIHFSKIADERDDSNPKWVPYNSKIWE